MKKLLSVFALMVLSGCSLISGDTTAPNEKTTESFVIESGDTGLVLKNTIDEEFEKVLSVHPILEAEIDDGILTYTEYVDGVPMTRVINLEAFVQFLNQ